MAGDAAVGVGLHADLKGLLALGILDFDHEFLVGEIRRIGLVVLGVADPELVIDRLVGPVPPRDALPGDPLLPRRPAPEANCNGPWFYRSPYR